MFFIFTREAAEEGNFPSKQGNDIRFGKCSKSERVPTSVVGIPLSGRSSQKHETTRET